MFGAGWTVFEADWSLDGWVDGGLVVAGGALCSYRANLQAAQRMSWVSLIPQWPQAATFSTFCIASRACHVEGSTA